MSARTRQKQSTSPAPGLNPKFEAFLREYREKLALVLNAIQPSLRDLTSELEAFHHYLDFEIDKARLALDRAEWQSQTPPAERTRLTNNLNHLLAMRNDFPTSRPHEFQLFVQASSMSATVLLGEDPSGRVAG